MITLGVHAAHGLCREAHGEHRQGAFLVHGGEVLAAAADVQAGHKKGGRVDDRVQTHVGRAVHVDPWIVHHFVSVHLSSDSGEPVRNENVGGGWMSRLAVTEKMNSK